MQTKPINKITNEKKDKAKVPVDTVLKFIYSEKDTKIWKINSRSSHFKRTQILELESPFGLSNLLLHTLPTIKTDVR